MKPSIPRIIRNFLVASVALVAPFAMNADAQSPATQKAETAQTSANDRALDMQSKLTSEAQHKYRALQTAVEEMRSSLRQTSGRFDVSRESLMKAGRNLDEQIEAIRLEQQAAAARREALEKVISEQSQKAKEQTTEDPVAAELEKLVNLRSKSYAEAQQGYRAGMVSTGESNAAAAALAEAKVRVAERRQLIVSQAGGDALPAWNRELLNLGIAQAEYEAKLKFLQERRDRLASCTAPLEDLARVEDELSDARTWLNQERANLQAWQLTRRADELHKLMDGAKQ